MDSLKSRLKAGKAFEGSAINYRKDGGPYLVHWKTWPITDEDGAVRCYVAVQHDEPRSAEAHTFTRALVEAMDSGVLGIDEEGRITFANDRAADMWGAPNHDALIGHAASTLFSAKTPPLGRQRLHYRPSNQRHGIDPFRRHQTGPPRRDNARR
ncbi:MAG: PAS domain-containing protein [Pseudomonadota bacterium]